MASTAILVGGRAVRFGGRDKRALVVGGLDAALAVARDTDLTVVACDMPFATAPFLAHFLALTAEADAVVPRTERGYQPLCGAYTRACRPAVQRRIAERRLAMLDPLEDVHLRTVEGLEIEQFGKPERLLANANTPDDLAALLCHER